MIDYNKYWPKVKIIGTLIGIILVLNQLLLFFLPTIQRVLTVSPIMKVQIAQYLLVTTVLSAYLVLSSILGKYSELKCPYCGSYKFFLEASKTTGETITKGSGLVKRLYKCKDCGKSEKIFVKPISVNLASDDG